ncbi:MAG: hypothetical protein ACYCOR_19170 [Acidobacteriaceae bacterium]
MSGGFSSYLSGATSFVDNLINDVANVRQTSAAANYNVDAARLQNQGTLAAYAAPSGYLTQPPPNTGFMSFLSSSSGGVTATELLVVLGVGVLILWAVRK